MYSELNRSGPTPPSSESLPGSPKMNESDMNPIEANTKCRMISPRRSRTKPPKPHRTMVAALSAMIVRPEAARSLPDDWLAVIASSPTG
jgi:hypothetical protein